MSSIVVPGGRAGYIIFVVLHHRHNANVLVSPYIRHIIARARSCINRKGWTGPFRKAVCTP